ncbi:hypothetical protein BC938DRAFT_482065 [Jimgerdemannia flammicorona]|uniref:Uncharacterized protein n=1 Tax=Jimgerdemannia flammicorona TaxID=994334 RepID=A0A433QWS0_9FUNG|nr:hypothetical protein BC938DRAFT_482065 [Jimgerdemannia flammicorona]
MYTFEHQGIIGCRAQKGSNAEINHFILMLPRAYKNTKFEFMEYISQPQSNYSSQEKEDSVTVKASIQDHIVDSETRDHNVTRRHRLSTHRHPTRHRLRHHRLRRQIGCEWRAP